MNDPIPHIPPLNGIKDTDSTANELASYVYNVGFIHTAWADTILTISPHTPLRLHALFASRSPVLYKYLTSNTSPPYHINLSINDSNITSMALSMALATLYGQELNKNCDLQTAKGLMGAGSLLGLDNVTNHGYQILLSLISKDTIMELMAFALSNNIISTNNSANGSTGGGNANSITVNGEGPYPPFTNSLLSVLLDFVFDNFTTNQKSCSIQDYQTFTNLLINLPFDLFKVICQSDKLNVKNHMERYTFAKEVTQLRRKNQSMYEESVVLAFDGGKGGVEIIRKPIGKKKLWKASQ
jgi:hypothetical protein